SIDARLPDRRTRATPGTDELRAIRFGVHEGESRLASVAVSMDVDTRSDPVLPRYGSRTSVSLQTALPLLGSQYAYAKGVVQASWYHPVRRLVLGIHGLAGAMF